MTAALGGADALTRGPAPLPVLPLLLLCAALVAMARASSSQPAPARHQRGGSRLVQFLADSTATSLTGDSLVSTEAAH